MSSKERCKKTEGIILVMDPEGMPSRYKDTSSDNPTRVYISLPFPPEQKLARYLLKCPSFVTILVFDFISVLTFHSLSL